MRQVILYIFCSILFFFNSLFAQSIKDSLHQIDWKQELASQEKRLNQSGYREVSQYNLLKSPSTICSPYFTLSNYQLALKDTALFCLGLYKPDPVIFALSIDPLAESFASESPYSAMVNSPINIIDPDGKKGRYYNDFNYQVVTHYIDYILLYHPEENINDIITSYGGADPDLMDEMQIALADMIIEDAAKMNISVRAHKKDFREKRKTIDRNAFRNTNSNDIVSKPIVEAEIDMTIPRLSKKEMRRAWVLNDKGLSDNQYYAVNSVFGIRKNAKELNVDWWQDRENWENFQDYINGNLEMETLDSQIANGKRKLMDYQESRLRKGYQDPRIQDVFDVEIGKLQNSIDEQQEVLDRIERNLNEE